MAFQQADITGLMRRFTRALVLSLALGCMLVSVGCQPAQPVEGQIDHNRLAPKYGDVRARYNANLVRVDKLWSRAIVEMTWKDERGRNRFEQGEGNLILVKPDWMALSIGKLGNTLMWAGSDAERYWLFDMTDQKTAFVGRHVHFGKPCSRSIDMPVAPHELVMLLGLTELPEDPEENRARVVWEGNELLLTLPGREMDVLVDPVTYRPTRVRLLDFEGKPFLICRLGRPNYMTISNAPPGLFPTINTRFEVSRPATGDKVVLFLSDVSDGVEHRRIRSQAFDFDTLVRVLKPERVVDLDRHCE